MDLVSALGLHVVLSAEVWHSCDKSLSATQMLVATANIYAVLAS